MKSNRRYQALWVWPHWAGTVGVASLGTHYGICTNPEPLTDKDFDFLQTTVPDHTHIPLSMLRLSAYLPMFGAKATSWTGSKATPTMVCKFCHLRPSSLYSNSCILPEATAVVSSVPTTIMGGWILQQGQTQQQQWRTNQTVRGGGGGGGGGEGGGGGSGGEGFEGKREREGWVEEEKANIDQ